mgnify:CR=1 FL=1
MTDKQVSNLTLNIVFAAGILTGLGLALVFIIGLGVITAVVVR